MKGDLSTRTSPSDHRAVEIDIRLRQRPPPPRLKPYVIAHHLFPSFLARELAIYNNIKDRNVRYEAIVLSARAVHVVLFHCYVLQLIPPRRLLRTYALRS